MNIYPMLDPWTLYRHSNRPRFTMQRPYNAPSYNELCRHSDTSQFSL